MGQNISLMRLMRYKIMLWLFALAILFFAIGFVKPIIPDKISNAMYYETESLDSIKKELIATGNHKVYEDYGVVAIHQRSHFEIEDIAYSIYMSNVYDDSEASYNVYLRIMDSLIDKPIDSLDSDSRQIAIFYLEKAVHDNFNPASEVYGRLKVQYPEMFITDVFLCNEKTD